MSRDLSETQDLTHAMLIVSALEHIRGMSALDAERELDRIEHPYALRLFWERGVSSYRLVPRSSVCVMECMRPPRGGWASGGARSVAVRETPEGMELA